MSKGQALLFLKSNRLGTSVFCTGRRESNFRLGVPFALATVWSGKRFGFRWWLRSFWPTLPTLLPNPSASTPGTIDSSLLKDQKQPYQINYLSLPSHPHPPPPLNTWRRDRIPVWTCLNVCQWRTLIPETGKSPTSFSLLPENSPPFSPHLSPQRCQRDHSLSSGVAGTGWDTQRGDTPSQLSRSAMAQVQTRQRYNLIYPPCLFSPRHLFCLQHLSDKTSKAAEIKQKITEQMRAEKIQGWDGEAARKARAEQPAENWK